MRSNAVRQAIIAAVEAITPDSKAAGADKFKAVPPDVEVATRDRQFRVLFGSLPLPSGRLVLTEDWHMATYAVEVAYLSANEAAHARLSADMDLIVDALLELEASPEEGQVQRVEFQDAVVVYEPPGMTAIYTIGVEFDPRE